VRNTTVAYNNSDPTTRTGVALGNFPAWLTAQEPAHEQLNLFTIAGCQLQYASFGTWAKNGPRLGGGQQSMPLMLYNRAGRAVGQGPAGDFFVAVHEATSSNGKSVSAGPMASLTAINAGYSYTTIISGGAGVQAAMFSYGAELLRRSGKTPLLPYKDSFVLSHLGYWVDNGAAYYRRYPSAYRQSVGMEVCAKANNCTNEDALLAVQKDAVAREIPIRYFQWDDWAPLNWVWPPTAFRDGASHWLGMDPYNPSQPMPLSLYNGEWGGGSNVPALKKKYVVVVVVVVVVALSLEAKLFGSGHDGSACAL
jgi:hypothetical protein